MGVYLWNNEWLPGSNTVLYYPFVDDQLDKKGNSSISATGVNELLGYSFSGNNIKFTNPPTDCCFVSVWVKMDSIYSGTNGAGPSCYTGDIKYNFAHSEYNFRDVFQARTGESSWMTSSHQGTTLGTWYYMAFGYDGTKIIAYINGAKVWELTTSIYSPGSMQICGGYCNITVSEFIGEKVVRSESEVVDYYNATKSKYGIS